MSILNMQEAFQTFQDTIKTGFDHFTKRSPTGSIILSDKSVIRIGNLINGMSQHLNEVDIRTPRMVVVGTQSSGKSSLLNRIIGADLLPTGNQIVTRTPLSMELSPSDRSSIEFGHYQEGHWVPMESKEFTFPNPQESEKTMVRDLIRKQTVERAGNDMGISDKPIWIRIFAPSLPNLTLVDLPGLTMVACTDRGQPKNIKEQIRGLVKEFITPHETTILAVMAARTDLETDLALDLIKEVDPEGQRTVGIITKLDLMGERSHVGHYLEGEISKDLQLRHGYFGVVNVNDESDFFKSHRVYSHQRYRERVGIDNLSKSLSGILVSGIRNYLPQILQQVKEKLRETRDILNDMGSGVPTTPEGRTALVHSICSTFVRRFSSALNERGHSVATARKIKEIMVNYRKTIAEKDPFSDKNFPETHLQTIINNCEGNHMSFPIPAVEVLEHCLRDSKHRPIFITLDLSIKCISDVSQELISLCNFLTDSRFHNLNNTIRDKIINDLIVKSVGTVQLKTKELYDTEMSYIWTENRQFLDDVRKDTRSDSIRIRDLLRGYYGSILANLQHNVPKIVMHFMVNHLQDDIESFLYDHLSGADTKWLLEESESLGKKRARLGEIMCNLKTLHDEIHDVLNAPC